MGPPVLIKDVDEAADLLAQNQWMRPWLAAKIKDALLSGEIFQHERRVLDDDVDRWKGRSDGIVAEWRMASESEVLDYVDTAHFANVTGKEATRRSQEKAYVLHYKKDEPLYSDLPRQARVILDLLAAAKRDKFTEASIEVILTEHAEELKTRQPPIRIFTFYRRRFLDEGHLAEE
jgi:hypothetical protein